MTVLSAAVLITVLLFAGWSAKAAQASSLDPASAKAAFKQGSGNWWDALPRAEWKRFPTVKLPKSCAWFEVHKVAPGVFAIYEPGNWQEVISYLIVGRKRALLWDTGMNIGDMRLCVRNLTKLPVTVLNSHAHFDHMSGNYQFRRVWNVDNAYARAVAKDGWSHEYFSALVTPDSWNPNVAVPARYDGDTASSRPYKVTHWVHAGDRIDLGGRVLRVVSSPGHSPDGISLLDRAHGLLFVGDVFYNSDLYVFLEGSSLSQYTITARRLARLTGTVRRILPSHNVTMISSKWLTRMDEAFQAIRHGTATEYVDDPEYGIRVYDFGYFRIDVRLSDVAR